MTYCIVKATKSIHVRFHRLTSMLNFMNFMVIVFIVLELHDEEFRRSVIEHRGHSG